MKLRTLLKPVVILTASVFLAPAAFAQNMKAPSAVLVMLNSEQNRIQFAQNHNKGRDLKEIEKDAANVARVTKNDFKDHFDACPVYYFIDSNASKIKAHNLEGIIMNADGTPVAKAPTDFIIAFYGFPLIPRSEDERLKRGLVIADKNMQQLHFRSQSFMHKHYLFHGKSNYSYTSKHYDLDYKPVACYVHLYL